MSPNGTYSKTVFVRNKTVVHDLELLVTVLVAPAALFGVFLGLGSSPVRFDFANVLGCPGKAYGIELVQSFLVQSLVENDVFGSSDFIDSTKKTLELNSLCLDPVEKKLEREE